MQTKKLAFDSYAAGNLDSCRTGGAIAERYGGYVETRGGAPSSSAVLAKNVNLQCRAIYEKRVREQNVPASAVRALFARKIMQQAPGGPCFLTQDGPYARK